MTERHCGNCGTPWPQADGPWPRTCEGCQKPTWKNPSPVAVCVIPIVGGGILAIRRTIPPHVGRLALPGGYINLGESWQAGAVRELVEETGLVAAESEVDHLWTVSAPDSTILIFGKFNSRNPEIIAGCVGSEETGETVVLHHIDELAFPLHREAARRVLGG